MSNPPNRDQRIDAAIPVRFSDAREFLVEYSSNISLGGVFVRTSSPAPFGTVVRLSLELPGTGQSVPVTGQVAFVLPADQAARQGKTPGMGVRFARLDSAVQETLAAYVTSLQKTSKGRVLLVDDDVVQLQQLADMLRAHNLNVTTVSSAVKALEIVRFGGIDFILSDINMPRMDGFEFRDNLRSNPKTSSIPFVFLTASVDEGDRQVAGELGVKHFLTKPVQADHLLQLLRAILGEGAFVAGNEEQNAGTAAPEAKTAKQKQAQRRIVEIAYRKFVALGMDTRFTADERGVFGQLQLKSVNIQDPVTGARLDRAGFYSVGHDRAKPFWPRALGALPMIPILDLPNGQALEQQIAVAFQRKLDEVRKVKQFLDKFGIPNRYEPITLRVLGQVQSGREAIVFSVRDPKTIFLESINGQSFGAVAAMRARLVDISDAKSGVDIEIELETVCKRLKEDLARATPQGPATTRSISASGATMLSSDMADLSAPDESMRAPAAPPVRAPMAPPAPAPAPAAVAPAAPTSAAKGAWIGAAEDEEFPLAAGSLPVPSPAAPGPTANDEEIWPQDDAGITLEPMPEMMLVPEAEPAAEPEAALEPMQSEGAQQQPAWSPAVESYTPQKSEPAVETWNEPVPAAEEPWSEAAPAAPDPASGEVWSEAAPEAAPAAAAEEAWSEAAPDVAPAAVEEVWSEAAPEVAPAAADEVWSEAAPEVAPAAAEEAWSEAAPEAAPAAAEEAWSEAAPEAAPAAAEEVWSEAAPEAAPAAAEEVWSEAAPEAAPVAEPYADPPAEPYAADAVEAEPTAEPQPEWSEPTAPVDAEPPLATAEPAWSAPDAIPDAAIAPAAGEEMWSAESEEPAAGVMPASIDLGPETSDAPTTALEMNQVDAGFDPGSTQAAEFGEAPDPRAFDFGSADEASGLELDAPAASPTTDPEADAFAEPEPEPAPAPAMEAAPEATSAPAAPPVAVAKSRYGFFAGAAPAAAPAAPAPAAPAADPTPPAPPAPAAPAPTASEVPPADLEARQWADEWVADESSATPLWSMQPADSAAEATPLDVSSALASSAAASSAAASGSSDLGTPMVCTQCGETYILGDDIDDERLLLLCPACIAKQG